MSRGLVVTASFGLWFAALGCTAQAGDWQVSVTPRVAVNFLDVPGPDNPDISAFETDDTVLLLGGLTVGLANSDWGGTELLATALYGEGDSDFRLVAADGFVNRGTSEDSVLDLELLVRTPLGDTGTYVVAGAQFREVIVDLQSDVGAPSVEDRIRLYLAKVGIGTTFPLAGTDKHRLFGNFLVLAGPTHDRVKTGGDESEDWGGIVGADVNMGWQYIITPDSALAFRYRVQLGRLFSQDIANDDWTALHGPELNLTYRF